MPPALRARPHRLLLHLRRERHPHHRRRAAAAARSRLGAHPSAGDRSGVFRQNPRAPLQSAPRRRRRAGLPQRFGKSARRQSKRRPSSTSPPAISRPPRSPAAPWRSAISPSGRSPTPTPGSRAPTCWPGSNRPPNIRRCSTDHVKIAESEEGLGLLALRDGAKDEARQHFAARHGGGQRQRALLHRVRRSSSPTTTKADAGAAQGRRHQPQTRRAVRPDGAARHRPAQAADCTGRPPTERNPRNPDVLASRSPNATSPTTITREAAKAWKQGEQAATDPAVREQMRTARMSIEQQRLDYEEAEKQPRGRRGGPRSREAEGPGARRGDKARSQIQQGRAEVRRAGRALVGRSEARTAKSAARSSRSIAWASRRGSLIEGEDRQDRQAAGRRTRRRSRSPAAASSRSAAACKSRGASSSNISRRATRGWPPPAKSPPSSSSDPATHAIRRALPLAGAGGLRPLHRHQLSRPRDAGDGRARGEARVPSHQRRVRLDRQRLHAAPTR